VKYILLEKYFELNSLSETSYIQDHPPLTKSYLCLNIRRRMLNARVISQRDLLNTHSQLLKKSCNVHRKKTRSKKATTPNKQIAQATQLTGTSNTFVVLIIDLELCLD
jgi:hypothetical protein